MSNSGKYLLGIRRNKKGFIVDPGGYSAQLTAKAKQEGVCVEYIILTHGHGDHISGIADFKKDFPNVKIVAFEAEKEMLQDANLNESMGICGYAVTIDADIYVKDRQTMVIGETELTLCIHQVIQKAECASLLQVTSSAATLCSELQSAEPISMAEILTKSSNPSERLFVLPDNTVVLPGHMGETTIAYEKEHNPFV